MRQLGPHLQDHRYTCGFHLGGDIDIGFTPEEAPKIKLLEGAGCPACNNTGYKGRVGLYEVMVTSYEPGETGTYTLTIEQSN